MNTLTVLGLVVDFNIVDSRGSNYLRYNVIETQTLRLQVYCVSNTLMRVVRVRRVNETRIVFKPGYRYAWRGRIPLITICLYYV